MFMYRNKKISAPFYLKQKCLIWGFVIYFDANVIKDYLLGPVVQRVVSLTSSLVVKMLTVLESIIPNSQVFLLKKM